MSKWALITSWIQNSPFHRVNLTNQQNLRSFFNADKVTCDTKKANRSKPKKLTFSLAATKFCNYMLRATTAIPTQLLSGCKSIHFWMEKSFAFPPKDCALLHFDFLCNVQRAWVRECHGVLLGEKAKFSSTTVGFRSTCASLSKLLRS